MEHLRGLCEVLDLSLDEAVQGAPNVATTGTEQLLLERFRDLPDAAQETVLALLATMGRKE